MLMSNTSINQLLSCKPTKQKLSYHLPHVSLEHSEGKAVNVVVVCDTDFQPTEAHQGTSLDGGWYTHSSTCLSEHSRVHLTEGARLVCWQTQMSVHGFGVAWLSQCHNTVDSLNWKERCKLVEWSEKLNSPSSQWFEQPEQRKSAHTL